MLAKFKAGFGAAMVAALGACASAESTTKPFNFTTDPGSKAPGGEGAGYTLSTEELGYDCKKLAGRMQVRILDLRGYATREKTTMASRGMHTAGKMVFGGTNSGLNTDRQYAKDMAMLETFNQRLVAKDCRSYNLSAALAGTDTPLPTVEQPSKAKNKAATPPKL